MTVNFFGGGGGKLFESAEQTIVFGGSLTVAHGLGKKPRTVQKFLVCKVAEYGFSVGDVMVSPKYSGNSGSPDGVIRLDATNIYHFQENHGGAYHSINISTNAVVYLTAANWKIIFKATA